MAILGTGWLLIIVYIILILIIYLQFLFAASIPILPHVFLQLGHCKAWWCLIRRANFNNWLSLNFKICRFLMMRQSDWAYEMSAVAIGRFCFAKFYSKGNNILYVAGPHIYILYTNILQSKFVLKHVTRVADIEIIYFFLMALLC